MNLRWLAMGAVAVPLAACAASAPPAGEPSEAARLEKFAVSQCLMRAFPDTPVAEDARRASGGYVELGSAQAEVYEKIVTLVQAHRAKPYTSRSGGSLHVMQCLDLLDDPGLSALTRPYR